MNLSLSPSTIVIMFYTWPFLFASFVGSIIWIWRDRVYERSTNKLKEDFFNQLNSDRHNVKNYADNIKGHLELELEKTQVKFEKNFDRLVRQVNRLVTNVALMSQIHGIETKTDLDEGD